MLFNSLHFLIFLPLLVLGYYALPPAKRWVLIFFASCYFYMAFVPAYILILFFVILVDYFSAIAIENNSGTKRKFYLIFSLLSNIALLAFFKYFNFINENIGLVANLLHLEFKPLDLNILLPIGLSFHTFQSMSYTIEVYRGKQKAERHLGYFANYVLFFPQMVAGPIERYDRLGQELRQYHAPNYNNFSEGFRLVLFGLFVKMVLADSIAPYVNEKYLHPGENLWIENVLAVLLFSFQIYADFFGYSTIALGSAKLLGVRIMDNFKTPYLSASITEFWSRWHISLSTWFKDYLYIPMGGNRVNALRWVVNIMVVFMVSGLWHGASWTFVVWGALHGGMLVIERMFSSFGFVSKGNRFVKVMLVLKTFLLTSIIWIFFRAENFEKAKVLLKALTRVQLKLPDLMTYSKPVLAASVLFACDILLRKTRIDFALRSYKTPVRWVIYAGLLFALLAWSGAKKFTFIYFQF